MKPITQVFALTMLLIGVALAQAPAANSEQANSVQIAPGATIPVELTKSLDAHKVKVGDPVNAKVVQDMLSNGRVVIPRDSKITGHVTEATPKGKGDSNSSLGIAFDKMILKGGQEAPLNASIQALAKPQQQAYPAASNEPAGYGGSVGVGAGSGPAAAGRGGVGGPIGSPQPTLPDASENPTSSASTGSTGAISASTQGVIGMKGLSLSKGDQGTLITSDSGNVHLDSGTQMILRVEGK